MRKMTGILLFCFITKFAAAQEAKEKVERACLDYIEGFYEGDTVKLIRSLDPSLYKFGYWKNKNTNLYEPDEHMTFSEALTYAKKVMEKKSFPKPGAPKKVEVLDIMNTIAAAKVTAWWGVDYVLLSKQGGQWMIEEVLWEGPLEK
jgi:Putative lumazine-binding